MSNPIWQHKQQLPEPENNNPWWSSRPVLIIVLAILAIIILTVLWHSLLPSDDIDGEEIPYITADQSPIKTRPANPGGYQPPHKDKMVYELISKDKNMMVADTLQPEAEKPIAETKFHNPSELSSKETKEVVTMERAKDGATYNIESETVNINHYSDDDVVDNKPEKVSPHNHRPTHGKYRIQAASMDSEEAAQSQWNRLKKKHGSMISNLNADFVKALVKGKTYYRVYIGNFSSKAKAQAMCNNLKKAGSNCFVVER
jgi:cell division protein FtsN